jgi:rhodanese-related sulfurtransferase
MTDPVETIPPGALWELSRSNPIALIDVRTSDEFVRLHARGAANVPLQQLDARAMLAAADGPIYLICRAGARSRQAAERLRAVDPEARVMVVEGGTLAWYEAGLPLVRGPDPRRWVRRARWAAGAVVVASVLLAIFIHRGWLGIAALVGAATVGVLTWQMLAWRWENVTEESPD